MIPADPSDVDTPRRRDGRPRCDAARQALAPFIAPIEEVRGAFGRHPT